MDWLPLLIFGVFVGGFQILFLLLISSATNPISLVPLLAPPAALWLWSRFVSRPSSSLKLFAVAFLTTYIAVVGMAKAVDAYLVYQLDQFDLNGDGVFSGEEITPAQERAMQEVAWDTGRALAPITGIGVAVDYALLILAALTVHRAVNRKWNK